MPTDDAYANVKATILDRLTPLPNSKYFAQNLFFALGLWSSLDDENGRKSDVMKAWLKEHFNEAVDAQAELLAHNAAANESTDGLLAELRLWIDAFHDAGGIPASLEPYVESSLEQFASDRTSMEASSRDGQ